MINQPMTPELRESIYGQLCQLAAKLGKDPHVHVQMATLTEFMDGVRRGDPIIFNFVRNGVPIFDIGFFQPLKKLLFMGAELAQWSEWSHDNSLDWHLLNYQRHTEIQRWVKALNNLYRSEPALYQLDYDPAGFEWIDANNASQSVISFVRKGKSADDVLLVICNFTPMTYFNYRTGVPRGGLWKELLNSDAREYGGSGQDNLVSLSASAIPMHGRPYSLEITLPPLAVVYFKSREHK
jgi:1,4-alpha-glucan branching enzyme